MTLISLVLLFLLRLQFASATFSWHSLLYEFGFLGAHPTTPFRSFGITPPEVNLLRWDPRCENGYILLSPRGHFYPEPGPLIYDNRGNLVWIEKDYGMIMDLNVQRYRDQDFLTFWVGEDDGTRGLGSYYMLNSSYNVAHIVSPANGLHGDVHDFKISDEGTALMTIYDLVETDLTPAGKSGNGWIYEGIFQEVDIETGELLFQWSAGDYYELNDSYFAIGDKGYAPHQAGAYDYYHINSIEKRADGTYLVSSRYMHSVTCISATGEVLWVLGGKRNMFKDLSDDGSATGFTWQHDARWYSDRTITLLDNGANEHEKTADHTRGLMIELDFDNWTARTLHVYHSPGHFSSHSQGNLQILPQTGNVFIGWGKPSAYTEFSIDGTEVLCDAHYGPSMFFWFGWIKSYRVQKAHWIGKPSWPPSVAVDAEKSSQAVYVSWNGATEVAGWLLQQTKDRASGEFETLSYEPKKGFETRLELAQDTPVEGCYFRVAAVDHEGVELGYTRVFTISDITPTPSPTIAGPDGEGFQQLLIAACVAGALLAAAWKYKRQVLGMHAYSRGFVWGIMNRYRHRSYRSYRK